MIFYKMKKEMKENDALKNQSSIFFKQSFLHCIRIFSMWYFAKAIIHYIENN